MIDIATDRLIFPAGVGDILGRRISPATIWRWMRRGILAEDGTTRVRLAYIRVGRSIYTSVSAVQQFAARLTGDDVATVTVVENGKAHDAAVSRLDAVGI